MVELIRFELGNDTSVLVETADATLVRQHSGNLDSRDGGPLEDKLAGAAEAAEAVSNALRDRLSPDELTLELGLKVSGQANWFIGKAASEGTLKVTLKWKKNDVDSSISNPSL